MNLPKRNKETYKPSRVLIQQPGFQVNSQNNASPHIQAQPQSNHECRKNRRRHL